MALTKQILLLIFVYGFVISVTCKKVTVAPVPAPFAGLTQFEDGEVIPTGERREPFESNIPGIAGLAPMSPDEEDYDEKDKKGDGSKDEDEDNGDSMDEKDNDSKKKEDDSKDEKEDEPEEEEDDDSKDEKEDESKDKKKDSKDKKNDDGKDKKEEDSKGKKKDDSKDEKEGDSKNKKDDPKDDKKDNPKMKKEGDSKDEKKKEKRKNESKDKTKDNSKAEKEGESKGEIEDGSADENEGDVATVVGNKMRKIEKKIHEFSASLKEQMNSPKSHECCLECDEVLGAALDDIRRTLESLANDNLVKANFDVSAITTNVDTCNECFEEMVGGDPKAKKLTDYVQKTTGDALEALKKAES